MQLYLETRFEQLKVSNLFVVSLPCCMQGCHPAFPNLDSASEWLSLPLTQRQSNQAHAWVSLDLICPEAGHINLPFRTRLSQLISSKLAQGSLPPHDSPLLHSLW